MSTVHVYKIGMRFLCILSLIRMLSVSSLRSSVQNSIAFVDSADGCAVEFRPMVEVQKTVFLPLSIESVNFVPRFLENSELFWIFISDSGGPHGAQRRTDKPPWIFRAYRERCRHSPHTGLTRAPPRPWAGACPAVDKSPDFPCSTNIGRLLCSFLHEFQQRLWVLKVA